MQNSLINPYQEWLGISAAIEGNPNDYQLLGIRAFESDKTKIENAYKHQLSRLEKVSITTPLEQGLKQKVLFDLETARSRLSDRQARYAYNNFLVGTGRAGIVRLGFTGHASILSTFGLGMVVLFFTVAISEFNAPMSAAPVSVCYDILERFDEVNASVNHLVSQDEPLFSESELLNADEIKVDASVISNTTINNVSDFNTLSSDLFVSDDPDPNIVSPDLEAIPVVDPHTGEVNSTATAELANTLSSTKTAAEADLTNLTDLNDLTNLADLPGGTLEAIPVLPADSPVDQPEPALVGPDRHKVEKQAAQSNEIAKTDNYEKTVIHNNIRSDDGLYIVPSADIQKKLTERMNTEFSFDKLRSPEEHMAVASLLFTSSNSTGIDVNYRYVLLCAVINHAAMGCDPDTIIQAVNILKENYSLDYVTMLRQAMVLCADTTTTKEGFIKLYDVSMDAINMCILQDKYSDALKIADSVYHASFNPSTWEFRDLAMNRRKHVDELNTRWTGVVIARQQLLNGIDNPAQPSEVIALWYIEMEEDWSLAVPYLTKSSSESLARVAHEENSLYASKDQYVPDRATLVSLADKWSTVTPVPEALAKPCKDHSIDLYKKALVLNGSESENVRIRQRIDDLQK